MTITADMPPKRKKRRTRAHSQLYKRLGAIRDRKGMSTEQLADHLRVPLETLRAWLYGKRSPSSQAQRLIQLAEKDKLDAFWESIDS